MFHAPRITGLKLLIAAPLLLAGHFGSAMANECAETEVKLQKEQAIILERESELSERVGKSAERVEKFEQDELERLIERHHASIAAFNLKLEAFKKHCGKALAKKPKNTPPAKTVTSQKVQPAKVITPKTELTPDAGTAPANTAPVEAASATPAKGANSAEAIAASDALIKTLKGYYIQVGAFKNPNIAERFVKRLEKRGFTPIIIVRPYVHAIWIGPYTGYKEATEAKETLLTQYRVDGYIIRFK